jgi:peptidoglycan/LPS O-acetylase OafA/YrhL
MVTSKQTATKPLARLDTAQVLRRVLLALAALGVIGTTIELILIGHYQEPVQWPPLIFLALTAVGIIVMTTKPTPRTLQLFRWLMVIVALSSLAGVYFHLHSNMEFTVETKPDLTGLALFWKAIQGGIPLLAPGVMAQVGLLGLAATFRHPALKK